MRWREFVAIAGGAALIYVPSSAVWAPDLHLYLVPWLKHIEAAGPIAAFARRFSNYSPPYLYLLSLFSLFGLPYLATIKLLAIAGAAWLAWCVSRLAGTLGCDPFRAAGLTLLLPTVILNGPVLGQCDTLWAGCCVLAVAAATKDRPYRMAVWAGIGFAFKAQAAFLAPFCIGYTIRKRAWATIAIPPLIYLAAVVPAALAGWPFGDLLTIYLRQPLFSFLGDAPNLWAIPGALHVPGPSVFPFGYALGAAGAAAVVVSSIRARDLVRVALLSALLIPFLLPKMHERFFFLADILSLAIAYVRRDRISIAVAILIQAGSYLSVVAYLREWPWLNAAACLPMGAALIATVYILIRTRDSDVSGYLSRGGVQSVATAPEARLSTNSVPSRLSLYFARWIAGLAASSHPD